MNLGVTGNAGEDAAAPVMDVQQKHESTSRKERGLARFAFESRASKQLWELDDVRPGLCFRPKPFSVAKQAAAEPASFRPPC